MVSSDQKYPAEIREKFRTSHERHETIQAIAKVASPFYSIEDAPLDELLDRIGEARLVLIGESTHGTSEFYRLRVKISQELILKKGFQGIFIEADWPDVEILNRFVRHLPHGSIEKKVFKRFPGWMWKNEEFHSFVKWLRQHNSKANSPQTPVHLYGLDLYNFHRSVDTILAYLDQKNVSLAKIAREKYGKLISCRNDLSQYGIAAATGKIKDCEEEVISVLLQLLNQYANTVSADEDEFLPIFQNAISVKNAEEYYRTLYQSMSSSWNVRDRHMFETVETLLSLKKDLKLIIWAHNSHVGNAAATEMKDLGEFNLGQLCKEKYKEQAYSIGFGTHKGTVAATSYWGGPMEVKEVRVSNPKSVERLFHDTAIPAFFLPLKTEMQQVLSIRLIQRAIGVVYIPENEQRCHYLHTILPEQFDEFVWIDHTHAVKPLSARYLAQAKDTFPFGI